MEKELNHFLDPKQKNMSRRFNELFSKLEIVNDAFKHCFSSRAFIELYARKF